MLRLIAFLWTGCWHKWKILRKAEVVNSERGSMPVATVYELQCERCGNVKGTTIRP